MKKTLISLLFCGLLAFAAYQAWAACTNTTNLSLCKPALSDTNWHTLLNDNFDTIDDIVTDALTFTNKTLTMPGITGYTVAGLPAAGTAGRIARLTDGPRTGSLVIDDGTVWRCQNDAGGGIVEPFCPPYNVEPRAGTAASVTGMQLALDRMKNWTTSGIRDFKCLDLGEDVTILPGSIIYDTDDASNLFCAFSHGNGGFQFTEDNAAYGLRIAGTGQTNVVWMVNISISGGGSNTGPLKLVDCDECVQVWIDRIRLGDASFTGLSFTGGGHVSITNSLFSENAVGDTDAAYVRTYGTIVDLHMSGNESEGFSSSSTSCHLQVAASGTIGALEFTGNIERGAGIRCLIDTSNNDTVISRATITGNIASNITQACFDFRGGNANSESGLTVTGNTCSCLAAGSGDFFFAAHDLTNSVVANNTVTECDTGIRLAGANTTVAITNNVFAVDTYGVDIQNDSTGVVIDGLLVDGASTADVNIGAGTSGGGNLIKGVKSTDGSKPIITIASTGWDHATDMVVLADGIQEEACGASLTLAPVYSTVVLAATGSPCTITLTEPNTNYAPFDIFVTSSSGTTANIASDGSIAKLDAGAAWNGGAGDLLTLAYNKAAGYFYERGRSNN